MWFPLFLFFVLMLPFSFTLNPAPNMDLPLIRAMVPLLFFAWLSAGLFKKRIVFDARIRLFLLLAFVLLQAVSLLWAMEQSFGIRKAIYLVFFLPLYFVAFAAAQTSSRRKKVLLFLCWSGFLVSIFAIIQFALQFILGIDKALAVSKLYAPFFLGNAFSELVFAYPSWLVNISGRTLLRAFATFPDPHLFSLFVNMIIPLSLYLYSSTKKHLYLLMALVMLFASMVSFSRASYLGIAFALVFFLTSFHGRKVFISKFSALVVALLFVVLLLALPNPFSSRFFASFELTEGSNSGRIEMWSAALDIMREKPLGGVGLGNFSYYVDPAVDLRNPIYAHNILLDFGSETGLVSVVLLLALLFSPILKYYFRPSPFRLAIAASFVIFLVHSMFENPFYSVRVFSLFIILLSFKSDA